MTLHPTVLLCGVLYEGWWRLGLGCALSAQAFWVFFMESCLTLTSLAMQPPLTPNYSSKLLIFQDFRKTKFICSF